MSFFVSHAAHVPERRASLASLLEQLGDVPVTVIGDRLPNHEWSRQMWQAGCADERPVFLQDDDVLCNDFHDRLRDVRARFPTGMLSLYQAHPQAPKLAGVSAIRMPGVLGTAYSMRREDLLHMLAWRASLPRMRVRVGLGEDQILTAYSYVHDKLWLHPVPGLVDHDAGTPSTNPYVGGFPRATSVASGPCAWSGAVVDRGWLWRDSEKTCADIAIATVPPGGMRLFGRTPLQRGPESRSKPVLQGQSIYTRATGEKTFRLHQSFTTELEADLALDALCRAGAFAVWIEDHRGPIDIFDYSPQACEWIDASTHYHTGSFAQQMDAAVASLGEKR